MMNKMKLAKAVQLSLLGAAMVGVFAWGSPSVQAAEQVQLPAYETVTEVFDWGPSISKLVVNLGETRQTGQINASDYRVRVKRILPEGSMSVSEFLAQKKNGRNVILGSEAGSAKDLEGERKITRVYVSDAKGNEAKSGQYVTIEMEVGPTDTLGAALNFDLRSSYNDWVDARYTITENRNGKSVVVNNKQGDIRPQADKFKYTVIGLPDNMSMPVASYEPQDTKKHPLIVWLHGMGEGGSSPSLPIMGNKVTAFAEKNIQDYFGGAYVMAPQARTYWMQGHDHFADGTSVYSKYLMQAIKAYAEAHPGVDVDRIYVGGDSNGGYMTMLLVRDNPGYFAAAFPTCEGLADKLISEKDLANLAKTPLWFTAAKTDTVLPPQDYSVPTVERLKKAGAEVHFSFFDNVVDQTGLYKKADGTPYEYPGHWSWIYVYNDKCEDTINGKTVKLFRWMAQQHR